MTQCVTSEPKPTDCWATDTCARPPKLDCHFETICEGCTFFLTTSEFRPTLQSQRDDAACKGQIGRQQIFDGLLQRLDDTGT